MGVDHWRWISGLVERQRGAFPPPPTPEENRSHRQSRRRPIVFFDTDVPDVASNAYYTAGPLRRMQHTAAHNAIARHIARCGGYSGETLDGVGPLPAALQVYINRESTRLIWQPEQKTTFETLPPEIRNLIYDYAYGQSTPVALEKLRMPRSLCVPGIFTEGLPYFFANTPIVVTFRSNWCIRYQHLHTPIHIRYPDTGTVKLPGMLCDDMSVAEEAVRFRNVELDVQCACCSYAKTVCTLELNVVAFGMGDESRSKKGFLIEARPISSRLNEREFLIHGYERVVEGVRKMLAVAMQQVQVIQCRAGFNGLSVQDIRDLAMCFRDTSQNPRPVVVKEEEVEEGDWTEEEEEYETYVGGFSGV